MHRREFLKTGALLGLMTSFPLLPRMSFADESEPTVWYWKDCTEANLLKAVNKVKGHLQGKTAIKVHTGEPKGPNIIPPQWVEAVMADLPGSAIVECNVLYNSPRKTTEGHRETLAINGWKAKVDILDEDGDVNLPVRNGFHLKEVAVGKNLLNYESLLILTHFKGHGMGGFGGSLKNIAIGLASGKVGKAQVHGVAGPGESDKPTSEWPRGEVFMENMADSGKAILDHFLNHYACINVMRRMSVRCDCAGVAADPPTAPDLGIMASTNILAIDQACVDMVYGLPEEQKKDLVERIESRKGLRQLSAMEELGMGSRKYRLVIEG